ncbi:hypothetical protein KL919_003977 [Ogataea angusta]|nr:hypothetical protein KL919_003977 [Ogataea angusta]
MSSSSQVFGHIRKTVQTMAHNPRSPYRLHVNDYPTGGDKNELGVRVLQELTKEPKNYESYLQDDDAKNDAKQR